jgi:PAS domain S-box-containing protein
LTQFSVENASHAVFWMDSEGRIVFANFAACRSLGRSREELLSLSIPEIDPLFPKEAWGAIWEKVKTRGSMTFETQHQTKQGRVFPVEITTNYLEFDGKEYAFAFAHDITERKRAEAEMAERHRVATRW